MKVIPFLINISWSLLICLILQPIQKFYHSFHFEMPFEFLECSCILNLSIILRWSQTNSRAPRRSITSSLIQFVDLF